MSIATIFFSMALIINPLEMFEYDSDYGAQRCVSSDCTCKVSLSKSYISPVYFEKPIKHGVFFEESSAQFDSKSDSDIKDFLRKNSSQKYFTIIGYTDGCGTKGYNNTLAARRAQSVKRAILKLRPSAVIKVRTVSEIAEYHDPSSRRVDIITRIEKIGYPDYPDIKADYYLIDASGSMSSIYTKWLDAISISRPLGSKVYVSYTHRCSAFQDARTINPAGGTEIWYSYWWILDIMPNGSTLAIISDFDSEIPLSRGESVRIQQKAESKRIRVIAIRQ